MAFNRNQPRDRKGRFAKKGGGSQLALTGGAAKKSGIKLPGTAKVTVRASLSSATVTYGRTLTLIPGKVNIHLGVLARVEKAGSGPNFIEKRVDKALDKIAGKLPKGKIGDAVGDVLRGKKTDIGGVTVGGNRRRVNPTIRAATRSKKNTAGRKVRKPRQVRQPRQRRTS